MGEYIDWSARDCDAECAAQVIQSSLEVSQSAQQATSSVAEAIILLDSLSNMVEDIQYNSDETEGQVIQLRVDFRQLSEDINLLRVSIDESMVPTIDNSVLLLIIAILGAFTICIVLCLGVIGYTSYIEYNKNNKNKNKNIQSTQKKKKGYIRNKLPY